ncbi:serine/threonine-protein kinase 40-like [Perognathus longimembris pacificus]|uniref:serine/threonine-protein kinase 40-like n=1 Tax=Perognathus longimembris pacificus TaxID=214514 RepID=UPI00201963A0|nr:serine/threonine-protein kinase 40-like [Perognathus longimembris pacificus]
MKIVGLCFASPIPPVSSQAAGLKVGLWYPPRILPDSPPPLELPEVWGGGLNPDIPTHPLWLPPSDWPEITITNFCLGKHLVSEGDLLKDQRGRPAYISPDVLSDRPYRGKPSDIWALGVVLFTMLYGQFPFYDSIPQELFCKIKAAEYTIPKDGWVSKNTLCLIWKLLVLDPQQHLAAADVLEALSAIIASWQSLSSPSGPLQVVPDIDDQMSNADNSQEAKVTEECSQYEFENYMWQQLLLAEEKSSIHKAWSWVPKRQFESMPLVQWLGHDAQPMTSLDTAILAQHYLQK